jgi:hypothetical protein
MDSSAGGGERRRADVRARETEHLMSFGDQFLNNSRAYESGRTGDKDAHEESLPIQTKALSSLGISW